MTIFSLQINKSCNSAHQQDLGCLFLLMYLLPFFFLDMVFILFQNALIFLFGDSFISMSLRFSLLVNLCLGKSEKNGKIEIFCCILDLGAKPHVFLNNLTD